MILSTTHEAPGKQVTQSLGIVSGEAILGVNFFRDLFASIRDIFGGRSGSYQKALKEAREHAMTDIIEAATALGADAIVGMDIDYETISTEKGSMLMVSINGTAVKTR